jgi:hypothetical protein
MDRKNSYSAQEQYEYFIMVKNNMTRCEVRDRDITTNKEAQRHLRSFFRTLHRKEFHAITFF